MQICSSVLCFYILFCCLSGCKTAPEWKSKTQDYISSLDQTELMGKINECLVCHSNKEAQRGPAIYGMEYWYLYDQLQKFHAGIRGVNPANRSEHLMGIGVRKIRNNIEMAYLADWFAKQEPLAAIRTIRGDLEQGKELYLTRCSSCHGEKAEGNRQLLSPSLRNLEGWYFLEQMRKFRNGTRGYHRRDESGKVMAATAKDLADTDFKNIIFFIIESFGLPEAQSLGDSFTPLRSTKPF